MVFGILKETKLQQKNLKNQTAKLLEIEGSAGSDKDLLKNVINLSEQYQNENKRLQLLEDEVLLHDGKMPTFMEQ